MIFIGILVVETDPGLHYFNICIRLKDTQDRFEIEPTLNFMNVCVGLKRYPGFRIETDPLLDMN